MNIKVQLTAEEKYKQMSLKYRSASLKKIKKNAFSHIDLQGWRNFLIDKLINLSPKNILDLGGGLGDKMYRFRKYSHGESHISVVDFADQPTEIKNFLTALNINLSKADVFDFLNEGSITKYDAIVMFGFLHEIKEIKKLINNISKIIDDKGLVILSDNTLYRNAHDISTIFASSFEFVSAYKSKTFFNLIHKFHPIHDIKQKSFWKLHWGRVDNLLIIASHNKIDKIQFGYF